MSDPGPGLARCEAVTFMGETCDDFAIATVGFGVDVCPKHLKEYLERSR